MRFLPMKGDANMPQGDLDGGTIAIMDARDGFRVSMGPVVAIDSSLQDQSLGNPENNNGKSP
jgi:hypothetical protein